MIGKTLSHFRIIRRIGEGAMGVVYEAEDTTLDRKVALKTLPAELAADEERRSRFEREAKSIAALNHPNIVTVHSVQEDQGVHFITMELVEGRKLSESIPRNGISLARFFKIALPAADALSAAHQRGITHRDLKPDNIMINDDGRVKLLDFGLAKLQPTVESEVIETLVSPAYATQEGVILGTVAYMSPEQAVGKEADHRSDIFSLGVILFEMATGKQPFEGDTSISVLTSIIRDTAPSVSRLNPRLPGHLGRIIRRCLAKEPRKRYPTAQGLYNDLEGLKEELESGEHELEGIGTRDLAGERRRWPWLAAIGAVAVAGIFLGSAFFRPQHDVIRVQQTMLTTVPGEENDPSWSPDGNRVAYSSDESGNWDIWIRQVSVVGAKTNLAVDHDGYDGKPSGSPNGEWIAFVSDRGSEGIFYMPVTGGRVSQLVSIPFDYSSSESLRSIPSLGWSPDGSQMAYTIRGELYTVPFPGGAPTRVPIEVNAAEPAWSPDGDRIAFTEVTGESSTTLTTIWTVRTDGTSPVQITSGEYYDRRPTWSADGKRMFRISDQGGSIDIWSVPVNSRGRPVGLETPLTGGAGVGSLAISPDGARLSYSKVAESANIWSIDTVTDRTYRIDEATQLTSWNNLIEFLAFSPDREWLAFDSNRSGNSDIWLMRKDGTELQQLTRDPDHDFAPSWSPDGSQVLFYSFRTGNRDLFLISASGGTAEQLTDSPADDRFARWSPAGDRIAFYSDRSGNYELWLIDLGTRELKQLTTSAAEDAYPIWSPDGTELIFRSDRTGNLEVYRIAVDGGEPVQLTDQGWTALWLLAWDAVSGVVYVTADGGPGVEGRNIWAVSPADGSARVQVDFQQSRRYPSYSLATDGRNLYFPVSERAGDIWVADLLINP
jgi:Tol biopolymer transport system component/predicted Ser/Thr protein kinase